MADTSLFYRFAHHVSRAVGRPPAFAVAVGVVAVWAVSGPVFGFSETWQLLINTGTTIITFLMVFLVQYTQNRDGEAVQAKLDELILVTRASNTFIGAETLTGEELKHLRDIVAEKARGKAAGQHTAGDPAIETETARPGGRRERR